MLPVPLSFSFCWYYNIKNGDIMNKRENLDLRVSILGSTGSIGTQALEVIDDLKGTKKYSRYWYFRE